MDYSTIVTTFKVDAAIPARYQVPIPHEPILESSIPILPPFSGSIIKWSLHRDFALWITDLGALTDNVEVDVDKSIANGVIVSYFLSGNSCRVWGGGEAKPQIQKQDYIGLISQSSNLRVEEPRSQGQKSLVIMLRPERLLGMLDDFGGKLSPVWSRFLTEPHGEPFMDNSPFDPRSRRQLYEIEHCPFVGAAQRVFLEAKALELIAIAMAWSNGGSDTPRRDLSLKTKDRRRMAEAVELLRARVRTPPSLAELAAMLGMSVAKLKRDFKEAHGMGVHEYILARRMDEAREVLLDEAVSVKEAAYIVGYRSPSHFAQAFKRRFGRSPGGDAG